MFASRQQNSFITPHSHRSMIARKGLRFSRNPVENIPLAGRYAKTSNLCDEARCSHDARTEAVRKNTSKPEVEIRNHRGETSPSQDRPDNPQHLPQPSPFATSTRYIFVLASVRRVASGRGARLNLGAHRRATLTGLQFTE